ncbi:MAG: DUF1616 domain-containing protein [Methanosphaera sp.]|uniref:DUF1616 domain-containing protein n=1 Tax=Methanosphaera sp. TaxID=2666342 RepID=UPI002E794EFD|nr:DUF1616 domain-containing protein [Methanosphaera sp.]MEE1117070.1 DUF1616 domain-containing protein [Methanosphaera sp.]MEE3323812.1 DUF1616 domain-containing protein [Methanosphaera sp.]MEE3418165.1 DUF1616 domain-containing protein [Methanosphaera sp.]
MTQLNKIVKGALLTILIISIILVIYLVVIHNPGQDYTEFYIVDHNNNTTDFPINITQNSVEKIYIGITNQEHQDINYTIKVKKDNKTVFTNVKTIKDKENLQFPYYLDQTKTKGINQTITFELYKNDTDNPYRTLLLRYNVI